MIMKFRRLPRIRPRNEECQLHNLFCLYFVTYKTSLIFGPVIFMASQIYLIWIFVVAMAASLHGWFLNVATFPNEFESSS